MATIKERLSVQMKSTMKSGDKETLSFVRNLHAQIRQKEIDDRIDLDDAAVLKIIGSSLKQRKDSLEQFTAGGREDLAVRERSEIAFLMSYMPEQMGEDEIRKVVDLAIAEVKASSIKDLGNVMKTLMPMTQGKADGKLVSQIVKERLGGA